jgi:Mg2+-importing ATPase
MVVLAEGCSMPFAGNRHETRAADFARLDAQAVLVRLAASTCGLSSAAALERRAIHGPNVIGGQGQQPRLAVLGRAALNPLVVLLGILAFSACLAGDAATASLMLVMLAIGVGLRFFQETKAIDAVADLRALVHVHATVIRDGVLAEVPLVDLVPGDIVHLAAGDMVPADVRLLTAKDLCVNQSMLTGESFPVEKGADADAAAGTRAAADLLNVCSMGATIESGTAEAVVFATGRETLLGVLARSLEMAEAPTAFDVGMARFTWLMVGLVGVMAPLVFVINGLVHGQWLEAFFFALAVGVGLTPEMLPMIVTVCLARGAIAMSRKRVIVKHLDAIQNLGAMDVLCTDKTGTLTCNRIILERHCDVSLKEDAEVLALAWLTSHFQTGLQNLLDRAILDHEQFRERVPHEGLRKLDEIPFDFARRAMSVVVESAAGGRRLVCKGAPESVYERCRFVESDGRRHVLDDAWAARLKQDFDPLSAAGFRVLAIAYRDVEPQPAYSRDDERDLVLRGYVAFLDPPKDSAAAAVAGLVRRGVQVKVLTGDNDLVSRKICADVGIDTEQALLGQDVDRLDDAALEATSERTTLMARLSPAHKRRVIEALRRAGHVVGFLGDGVNDALALRAADVGITVDTAVDIARESADVVLLVKDLHVLSDGVDEGRKVFVNVLKYVRMGASSNFGNMFSMLGASLFLPFLPMTPLQILATNLLYDCSQVPIPTDDVDAELVAHPRPWSMRQVSRFILLVGPVSSIFDATTFAVLLFAFGCTDPARVGLFQTGWFVESLLTQTLVIHVIRTNRVPFLQSHASRGLLVTTALVALVGMWLPETAVGRAFGFVALPDAYWPFLGVTLVAYGIVTYSVKAWLVRRRWIE